MTRATMGWLLVGTVVAALGGIQGWRLLRNGAAVQGSEAPAPSESLLVLQERSERRRGLELQMRQALERGEFERAMEQARRLVDFDPIHAEARQVIEQVRREVELRERLEAAEALLERGREEEAIRRLFEIPPGFDAHARARLLAGRIAPAIAGRARADCLGLHRAGRLQEARERCRFHLDLSCHQHVDPDILERLRHLERGLSAAAAWRCPEAWAAWWGEAREEAEGTLVDAERLGDPALAAAVERWAQGGPGEVALDRLRRDAKGPEAAAWIDAIRLSEARLREGQSALLAGRLDEAEAGLLAAARAERAILREGTRSARLEAAFRTLARAFLADGQGRVERRQWAAAEAAYRRGLEADPHCFELEQAMRRLEAQRQDAR